MEALMTSLQRDWESLVQLAPRLVAALLVLGVLIWVGRLVGRLVVKLLERGKLTRTHKSFFRHLVTWLFGMLGVILALNVLGLQGLAAGLLAGGGMTAVVLGFAFRGIGENLLAGFFLAFSRPFEVGDLIQSGEFQGIVRGIELRCTHIRAADGRDVYIPSSQIFNEPVVNFTRDGLRRLSFRLGIDYGDDTERAGTLLLETIRGTEHVLEDPGPAVVLAALQPQYQEFEVAFWVDMFHKGVDLATIRSSAMARCRRAILEAGFTVSANVSTAVALQTAPAPPLGGPARNEDGRAVGERPRKDPGSWT